MQKLLFLFVFGSLIALTNQMNAMDRKERSAALHSAIANKDYHEAKHILLGNAIIPKYPQFNKEKLSLNNKDHSCFIKTR